MSTARVRERVPLQYGVAIGAVLLVSLGYAVFVGRVAAWMWGVVATGSLGLSVFVVYLLYRLVLAVERIAYEP